jgi:DNA-binding MarR family transcriptional regulator
MERLSAFRQGELYRLHDVVIRLDRIAQELLKPLGMSYGEFLVLLHIAEQPGTRHYEVARRMGLSKTSVSLRVKVLLDRQWVFQYQNRENRREQQLEPTAHGREMLDRAVETLEGAAEPLFAELGGRRGSFREMLATLQGLLEQKLPDKGGGA